MPMFRVGNNRPLYNKNLSHSKSVSTILQIAQDSKLGGHFKVANTMSRLMNF